MHRSAEKRHSLPQPEWFRLLQGFFTAGICVMGSRLVLSLRGAYYRHPPGDIGLENDQETRVDYPESDGTVMPLIEVSDRRRSSLGSQHTSLTIQ